MNKNTVKTLNSKPAITLTPCDERDLPSTFDNPGVKAIKPRINPYNGNPSQYHYIYCDGKSVYMTVGAHLKRDRHYRLSSQSTTSCEIIITSLLKYMGAKVYVAGIGWMLPY